MKKTLIGNSKFLFFILLKLSFAYANDIIVLSIPKCGTHLLTKSIELLTNKKTVYINELRSRENKLLNENEFLRQHVNFSVKNEDELVSAKKKIFFIYRDPRDQIVSRAYWILKRAEKHPLCKYQKDCPLTLSEIIDVLIKYVNQFYSKFLPWMYSKNVVTVKFENLIGSKGGGNDIKQKEEIDKIAEKLDINSDEIKINCIKNLFGSTDTFRKGEIGNWKTHFTKKQIKKFKKRAGDLLIRLDYEKDLNW